MSIAYEPTPLVAVAEPALHELVAVGDLMAEVCRAVAVGPRLNPRELQVVEQLPARWDTAVREAKGRR